MARAPPRRVSGEPLRGPWCPGATVTHCRLARPFLITPPWGGVLRPWGPGFCLQSLQGRGPEGGGDQCPRARPRQEALREAGPPASMLLGSAQTRPGYTTWRGEPWGPSVARVRPIQLSPHHEHSPPTVLWTQTEGVDRAPRAHPSCLACGSAPCHQTPRLPQAPS